MGSALGDVLVRDENELRPSQSFVRLIHKEIPPEAYPEAAVEEVRREFRRAYRESNTGRKWRHPSSRADGATVALVRLLAEVLFSVTATSPSKLLSVELPKSDMIVRALASTASAIC